MRNKLFALLLCIVLCCAVTVPSPADPLVWTDETSGHFAVIDDSANLIPANEMNDVLEAMKKVTPYCDTGLVTGSGYHAAASLAEIWAKSVFGDEDTIVFAIDIDARDLAIASENDMRRQFTVQDANTVTDNHYREASAGQYGQCAIGVFEEIGRVLQGENISRPMKVISNILIGLCLSILICFLIISSDQKRRNHADAAVITASVAAGAGTALLARKLVRTVHHQSTSGFGGGGGGGGSRGSSGGGGSFSSGSHGF